jgi:hypothetical protein
MKTWREHRNESGAPEPGIGLAVQSADTLEEESRTMRRMWTSMIFLAMLALHAAPLSADSPQDPYKEADRAISLAQGGDMAGACRLWESVVHKVSAKKRADIHYNLYLAYKKLDQIPEAWYHIDAYAALKKGELKAMAKKARLEELLSEAHVRTSLACEPSDARVRIGGTGAPLRPCPFTWWVAKDERPTATISAEGFKAQRVALDPSRCAGTTGCKVHLEKKAVPVKTPVITSTPVVEKPAARRSRILEWSLIGGGLAALAGGGVLHGLAASRNSDLETLYPADQNDPDYESNKSNYRDKYASDVKPKLYAAYGLYGVGGAAALTGAVLMFVRKDPKQTKAAWIRAVPAPIPGGTGVGLVTTF